MDVLGGRGIISLGPDKVVGEIISRLESDGAAGAVQVAGTWGSYARLLASHISKKLNRPIVYIRPHIDDADNAADDLQTFSGGKIDTLAAWEGEEEIADATDEIRADRLKVVMQAMQRNLPFIISAPVQALCQPVPKPAQLMKSLLRLSTGKEIPPRNVLAWLGDNGFERVGAIDLPGQFAHRGGIIDIYAPLVTSSQTAGAIRAEFFGDRIESLRTINLDTQLSTDSTDSLEIISAICGAKRADREMFLNILPAETILILEEPGECEEVANVYLQRAEKPKKLYHWDDIYDCVKKFQQLYISRFTTSNSADFIKVKVKSVQRFQQQSTANWDGHKNALGQLVEKAKAGNKVFLYCEAAAEITRVAEIITQNEKTIPKNLKLLQGFIHQGFAIESLKTIVISHHELFGQFALRRRQRTGRAAAPVDSLADLQTGDYVVHSSYGIGKFVGIKTIKERCGTAEYLSIEYADAIKLQVSVNNIALVQKYIGTSPKRPKLSKIGSKKWLKQKDKVAGAVEDLAAELLQVQAKRQALGGIAFEADSAWQVEFEESFPYQETPDQMTAAGQIKSDMQQAIAMDRLLCGDVGYGKTELAMRAAFKVAENGKQVAMLVPTTVLCVQHGRTFTERFADFPVCIEVLNRFKTTKQARDIIERTRAGKVDILIGTHRLLSGDVKFKNLGMLIIDEEQRFGVEHKEKLKRMRVDVDILSMSATPIPRTLHMALLGLRDISALGTPPLDRRSIITEVTSYNNELIRKTVTRELNRQGQVFFLHNRVRTIEKKAQDVAKLVPDARIGIAHGQMPKSELEKVMLEFITGQIDVLVCTTIIESGLDIPNANTILINDADRFGLAQLHQLRGRVGRYKHRAYAYMLMPKSRSVTPIAARRLKAIEEYSHLGAGFRIALRDLEIRGAGNILGSEQSGHIQLVGYQMYCDLLAGAVKKLRNEPAEAIPTALLDLGFTAYIPKNYIPADKARMETYRKIAVAKTSQDLKQIATELNDIYGSMPDEVKTLCELAQLRISASALNIKSIVITGKDLVFSFRKDAKPTKSLFDAVKARVTMPNTKTVYLRLGKNYFEQATLMGLLRKILAN